MVIASAIAMVGATAANAREIADQSADAQSANVRAKVIQNHIDAYRARDLERFAAIFAKDAEMYANGIVAKGHSQIRAFYRLNFAPGSPRLTVKSS